MLATSPSRLILLASGSNAAATRKLVPGGVTKHLYYGIFQNYIGFVLYDFFLLFFMHVWAQQPAPSPLTRQSFSTPHPLGPDVPPGAD